MKPSGRLVTDELPGRTLTVEGVEHLYFSGTSYLGVSRNEEFRNCLTEAMARYGTNYASTRISNLQLRVYGEVEEYLAAYTGAEAALTMSSGYLAGQMVVRLLEGSGRFLHAPRTHPALWLSPVNFSDQPYAEWVRWVQGEIPALPEEHLILVCNSLDPLQVRKYSFEWVAALPPNKKVTLLVDDSHGFGVTGPAGAGVYPELKFLPNVRLIVVTSFGKAFGIPGGIVLGEEQVIAEFRKSPFFGGASPIIPAYLEAFLRSQSLFSNARNKLFANIALFKELLTEPTAFSFLPDYPVFYTPQSALCPYLLSHRILISSFPYPTPADKHVTRIILNSLHTPEDLRQLALWVNQYTGFKIIGKKSEQD